MLRGPVRRPQPVHDPRRLPVERYRDSRPGVEDRDAHRRGVYQGLQVGPGPQLVPVPAGVGDDHRRLGGEHHQCLLVLQGELCPGFFPGQADVADALAPVVNRRRQEREGGTHRHGWTEIGKAHRPDVPEQVRDPQRLLKAVEVLEDLPPLRRQSPDSLGLFGGQPGGEEVLYPSGLVKERDHPVAGLRQRPGGVQHALQHRVEVEALVDAQAGLAQPGQPFPQGLVLSQQVVFPCHSTTSVGLRKARRSSHGSPAGRGLDSGPAGAIIPTLHRPHNNWPTIAGVLTARLHAHCRMEGQLAS